MFCKHHPTWLRKNTPSTVRTNLMNKPGAQKGGNGIPGLQIKQTFRE